MKMFQLPRYIGICGNPNSGKSEVQRILERNFNVQPVDDGKPLREIAMRHFGLTHDQVYTQAGKNEFVTILGKRWQVRQILGDIGSMFEATFGEHVLPLMATRNLLAGGSYSFGSVRKTQGEFYRDNYGVIIGVRNPIAPLSPYEFDRFDDRLVDVWIENDALSLGLSREDGLKDLEQKVAAAVRDLGANVGMAA